MGLMENKRCVCDCKPIHEVKKNLAVTELKKIKNIALMAKFFKNFSDDTRLKILVVLDKVGKMCVCDIADLLGMTRSAVSHQIKTLRQASLVTYRKSGKNVIYRLADDHVRDIIETALLHIEE